MPTNSLRSDLSALAFAVDFAQMPLATENLVRVNARLQTFLLTPEHVAPRALGRERLADVQQAAQALLRALAVNGIAQAEIAITLIVGTPGRHLTGRIPAGAGRIAGTVAGPTRDRFLYRLVQLIDRAGADRLQVCARPGCERLFFKRTRKEFCTTRCQARVYMARLRETERMDKARRVGRGKTRTRRG